MPLNSGNKWQLKVSQSWPSPRSLASSNDLASFDAMSQATPTPRFSSILIMVVNSVDQICSTNGWYVTLLPGTLRNIVCWSCMIMLWVAVVEGSLEAKLPTIWKDEKQRREESERRDSSEEKRSEERRCRCVKHWKSRFTVFFQWFVAPEGRKVGSLKRRVRSQLARWEMKNCTPLWHEAHFEVKRYKTHHSRTTFWSCDVEKVHAVVARSTFPSQNVQNTPMSDHFWKLRCRKSARRCGAKHISKWKCTKHTSFGPLLDVELSKKCTPLWREAHFQVKMYKTHQCRTTFGSCDVEKVHAVVARSTFPSQNVQNTTCSDHFWRFRCRKSVEKVHAVVARSTLRSQKCKKLRVLSLFWREDVEKVDTD